MEVTDSRLFNTTHISSAGGVASSNDVVLGSLAIGTLAYNDPFTYFPTTIFLVSLIHAVFLYQWIRRIPRKKILVTYPTIVQAKRFHKLWTAILSHPPMQEESSSGFDGEASIWDRVDRSFSPAVAMGGPEAENWIQGTGVWPQLVRNGVEWGRRQWKLLTKGSLSGFPLLLYNSHILWSCRALEQIYNENGDTWSYTRCLLGLVTLSIAVELYLSHALIQAIIRRQHQQPSADGFGEIQPAFDGSFDLSFLEQVRQRVERRAIGTMTSLTAALLVLFRFQYTDVPLAVLPFFTDRLFSKVPGLTYFVCTAILAVLARSNWVITGALVGLTWSGLSLHFLADAHHGNWLVLVVVILTLLSCKGQSPNMLPCIEYVSWYDADMVSASANEPMLRPLSWCFQPVVLDDSEAPSVDTENEEASVDHAEEALLEFTRVRSDSDSQEAAPVDPDLLEQGRRPRRTRIRSQRP